MNKFDKIFTEAYDDWDDWGGSDYLEHWDSKTFDWYLHVSDNRGMGSTIFIRDLTVKNTSDALRLYNMFAKLNGWPKITKKKLMKDSDFSGNFKGYKFSSNDILLVIGVQK